MERSAAPLMTSCSCPLGVLQVYQISEDDDTSPISGHGAVEGSYTTSTPPLSNCMYTQRAVLHIAGPIKSIKSYGGPYCKLVF